MQVIHKSPQNQEVTKVGTLLDNKLGKKSVEQNKSLDRSREKIEAYTKDMKAGSLEKLNKTKFKFHSKNMKSSEGDSILRPNSKEKVKFPEIANSKPEINSGKMVIPLTMNLKNNKGYKRPMNSSNNRSMKH